MEYKISDVAKMFGTSSEGIRFFERKGLLKGSRSSNDYRVYTSKDLFSLTNCIMYSKLGFSLSQAKSLFFEKDISEVSDIFENHIQEKEKELHREKVLLACLKDRKEIMEKAYLNEGRVIIEKLPGLYRYSSNIPEDTDYNKNKQFFLHTVNLLPASFSGFHFPILDKNEYSISGTRCSYVYEQYVRELNMELPESAVYYPEKTYATYVLNLKDQSAAGYNFSQIFLETLEKEGLHPIGDILVWYVYFSFKKDEEQRYCKIMAVIN